MEIIANYGDILLVLAIVFGLFMAWGVGANDVANAMGTSVGSGAITIKQAIIIAVIFEFAGAVLAGGEVTATIRKGILDASIFTNDPHLLVYGMLASLLAAGFWLMIASSLGWPVSTTHSIVGAIVGFGAVGVGVDAVAWGKVGTIAMSWIVSPILAGSIAFVLFKSLQKLIIDTENPFDNAKRYVPFYMFLVGFVISLVTIFKGLKHVGLHFEIGVSYMLATGFGVLVAVIGTFFVRRIHLDVDENIDFHFTSMERVFGILMLITAAAMAFAHGSNDVANAIGPLAAIYGVIDSGGLIGSKSALPVSILLVGGAGIVFGLVTYGHKVIATIGTGITQLTPSRGFAATLAAAATVVIASGTGLPVSTTQVLVGAVLGVGLARGMAALNTRVINKIFLSWLITLPAGALMSILFFFTLKGIFGA
ncbi:Probable low-affinity inorganic phosphate transporter [uncultured Gammaproteobacteria bacterium]|jgi:PiT family inorganic phosphate transporter|uniref:inorganic phosphate transporter n=1 Tax=thiotrophic endosymbiont of Bathymodiolus puteoserpentis (Logatchev) TaxID=343240 RepID=UPI0010BADE32|nr:inorganic phosphate transporter [thiotrophic endosymbiont of Bathymodiolus puteoserpentis (Logatchev)]CAC9490431.1 Probable low-affinity inorganic phosphate transporter [uncultured Gammaproteobacteria bacterium]CAC9586325.1 Probable low-affinity inorganic phosphate transporter [uncultured Gammaproteobacteria bacterium]CAC9588103.1 Probable low-affinity inorganic phosphate transporter [uncultured Gammaproteobacteria bacterium]CAC9590408.1 Probable low-affinity inorganic phosphate transporter 